MDGKKKSLSASSMKSSSSLVTQVVIVIRLRDPIGEQVRYQWLCVLVHGGVVGVRKFALVTESSLDDLLRAM